MRSKLAVIQSQYTDTGPTSPDSGGQSQGRTETLDRPHDSVVGRSPPLREIRASLLAVLGRHTGGFRCGFVGDTLQDPGGIGSVLGLVVLVTLAV